MAVRVSSKRGGGVAGRGAAAEVGSSENDRHLTITGRAGLLTIDALTGASHAGIGDFSEFVVLAHNSGLDCAKTPVYRGGGDLTPKYNLGEVKIKNGMVQPIRGVSLELDPADAAKHGVPHRVKSMPDELEIVQQGRRPEHYEIRPKVEMPVERFEEMLKRVVLEPIQ
jgi:hypothetical protein